MESRPPSIPLTARQTQIAIPKNSGVRYSLNVSARGVHVSFERRKSRAARKLSAGKMMISVKILRHH
jgi:thiamine monophosphate synthase